MDDPNDAQREAVQHGTGNSVGDARPLLVIAGAGSGPPQASSDRSGVPHLDEGYLVLSAIHSARAPWKSP